MCACRKICLILFPVSISQSQSSQLAFDSCTAAPTNPIHRPPPPTHCPSQVFPAPSVTLVSKREKKKKKKPNLMHARITACEVALWETPPSLSSALYALISASYLFHIPPLRRDLFLISLYTGPQLKMFICSTAGGSRAPHGRLRTELYSESSRVKLLS